MIVFQGLSDLSSSVFLERVHILVDLSDSVNSFSVLSLGFLDLHPDGLIGQLVLEIFANLKFFISDVVILLNGEFVLHGELDSLYFLFSVTFNELNHG